MDNKRHLIRFVATTNHKGRIMGADQKQSGGILLRNNYVMSQPFLWPIIAVRFTSGSGHMIIKQNIFKIFFWKFFKNSIKISILLKIVHQIKSKFMRWTESE